MPTLLVTTDFHADQKALHGLDKLLSEKRYDAVIMLGDLINPNPSELGYVRDFIDLVRINHSTPLFGLHGNNEPIEAMELYRQTDINIHLETKQFGGYNICGIGSFGYLNEPGVFEDLSVQNLVINQQTIFVTHVPPRELKAQPHGPLIHLFGHMHVLAHTKQLGETLLVQCPAGIEGRVTELSLPDKLIQFIDLPH
jgi:Icc-related predicted phosphoesterase